VDDLNTETTRVDDINHKEGIATTPIGHNTEREMATQAKPQECQTTTQHMNITKKKGRLGS